MKSELELFVNNIKPTLLLSKKAYKDNIDILKSYKMKIIKEDSYLIYKDEKDITKKNIGEILGYPPICSKEFELRKNQPKEDRIVSKFINYGGINFNCYENYNEAIEWCHKEYKEKLLNKYESFKICYSEVEFNRNYVKGYDRTLIKKDITVIKK